MNNNHRNEDEIEHNDGNWDEDKDKKVSPCIKSCVYYIYVVTKFHGFAEWVNSFCKWKIVDIKITLIGLF